MKRRIHARTLAFLALLALIPPSLAGNDVQPPRVLSANTADYSVHEWGTFTSIQGSDGEPIAWNPFGQVSDLPAFVFTRQVPTFNSAILCSRAGHFRNFDLKGSGNWFQRMETPVLYFHSQESLKVDVHVRFPSGLITEWFPQVSTFGPIEGVDEILPKSKESHLRWNQIRVLSRRESESATAINSLPTHPGESHYDAARATRANLVESTRPFASESLPQRDRFLFYRGAGSFTAPLRVAVPPDDRTVFLSNTGQAPLGPLFVVHVTRSGTAFTRVNPIAPGASVTVGIPSADSAAETTPLNEALLADLRVARLDADEAQAMVNTWRKDWLGDLGLRVLYLLPQEWTDLTLPLQLDPAPRSLVRVMVGRAEVFRRAQESRIASLVGDYLNHEDSWSVASLRALGLGRFLEPGITRAGQVIQREAFNQMFSCRFLAPDTAKEHGSQIPDADWNRRIQRLKDQVQLAESESAHRRTASLP